MGESLRRSIKEYGVKKVIENLLFLVFPNDSFQEHLDIFRTSIKQPSRMISITDLVIQLGEGATSHIAIVAREFLSLSNFPAFTRDYMKRCCDLVEYAVKFHLASKLGIQVGHKPLGAIIKILSKQKYEDIVTEKMLSILDSFNRNIYCPVKHEVSGKEKGHMYSVADAMAVTFISIRLSQQIRDLAHSPAP